jgi:hypothetical protein
MVVSQDDRHQLTFLARRLETAVPERLDESSVEESVSQN